MKLIRARSKRAPAPLSRANRPRDLGGPFEVQDAQGLAEFPVGFRVEREAGGLTPGLDYRVVIRGRAEGNRGVGEIGHGQEKIPHPGVVLRGP